MKVFHKIAGAATLLTLAAFAPAASAQTQQFNGAQAATYTGSNFTISGDTVTASQTSTAGVLTVNGVTSDLLGINGLWIVSPTGGTVSGVGTAGTNTSWAPESDPAGFGGHPGYGTSSASDWITLAPSSDFPSGKAPSSCTSGVFNFTGLSGLSNYSLGVDYLQKNGSTGRAYFTVNPAGAAAVPEPSPLALIGLGALPLALVARRRRGAARA